MALKSSDKQNFIAGLNACLSLYNKPAANEPVIMLWWDALNRFSLDDVSKGFSRHAQDPDQGQFVPKPADIIRNIEGNTQTQSELAWTKVDRAIRTVGPYQTVVFDDPLIHAVISDMGGWISLCDLPDEKELGFKHVEFSKRYRGYVNNRPANIPKKLIGKTEHHFLQNQGSYQRGMAELPKPVTIGDVEKCREVYRLGNNRESVTGTVGNILTKLLGD